MKEFTKSHILPPQLRKDSTTASTSFDKAELLNLYFYSVFTQSNFSLPNISDLTVLDNYLDSIHFTEEDVLETLSNLDPNKASGIDNIPPIFLKHCAYALVLPIHHLFATSINNRTMPAEWKMHKIVAVYKSGDKTPAKNYHPISLLCIVLERLIYDKIISSVSNCISQYQFRMLQLYNNYLSTSIS